VSGIVLDVSSPGGTVDGVPEMAARIRAARGTKPIVAVSDSQCCSAAYWLASQADELLVAPSSMTGSIGVFAVHTELSKFDAEEGITNTIIRAGKYKAEANDMEPLTDEARAHIQSDVDYFYSMFINDVAFGRGFSAQAVLDGFGEGRALVADEAVAAGLADGLGTVEDAIVRCASGKVGRQARAEEPGVQMVAVDLAAALKTGVLTAAEIAAGSVSVIPADPTQTDPPISLDFLRARSRAHR
jgi:signal peptide peptidase SppA